MIKTPTIWDVNSKAIVTLSQKLKDVANPNSQPIDKKYETLLQKFIRMLNAEQSWVYYYGELDEGKYKLADTPEKKRELVLDNIFENIKVDKESLKKLLDFSKKYAEEAPPGTNIKDIIFAKEAKGFKNESNKRIFSVRIPSPSFKSVFPQSRPIDKKQKKKFSKEEAAIKSSFKSGTPVNHNMAFSDGGNYNTIIRIGDIPIYTSVSSVVLKDLSNKVKEYDIILDRPVNLALQATKIDRLGPEVTSILTRNNIQFSDSDYIKIKFDSSYNIVGLYYVKAEPSLGGKPSTSASPKIDATSYFSSDTLNSIIYNLTAIYNRFGERVKQDGFVFDVQGTIFFSEESIRFFLNSYIYPAPNFTNSPITKDLIEKFIIGDIRLLDDETFKNSFIDPEQIPDGVRGNLEKEVSQGYEAIGDILGESWFTGKFERIDDVEQFKKQLLNYIDMKELISVAATCLLKLIPIDEALDSMCEPILKEFDKHKEKIIQELDKMEDGIAKDLAKELKEIYFNRIIGEQGVLGQIQGQVESGFKKIPEKIQDATTLYTWRDERGATLQVYFDLTNANYFLLNKSVTDDEVNVPIFQLAPGDWNGNKSVEKTFVYSGLLQRRDRLEERVADLEKELEKLQKQLAVFNGVNEPQNLVDLRSYYQEQISKQKTKLVETERGLDNGIELQELYQTLLRDVLPNLLVLDPYITDTKNKTKITLSGAPYLTQKGISTLNESQYLKSIQELNNIKIPTIKGNEPIFSFSTQPNGQTNSVLPSKGDFNFQISNGLKPIVDKIQQLQESDDSPFNIIASLENFGVDLLDATIQGIFDDPTKRRYLCLAIIASGLVSLYSIYLLFRNLDEVGEFLSKEANAIGEAIERKVEIFTRLDYPVLDILEEFVDSLKQIGINFARDLIINGIMWILDQLKQLCSDEEKTNAPYSPLGAIDLSDFINTSKKGANAQAIGTLGNSSSYKILVSRDGALTEEQFDQILKTLSLSLTINEIASLLDGSASANLYGKAVRILNTLVPDTIKKEGSFYKYYVNEAGIEEFFDIISQDIEPAKIARAKREYRLSKQRLLEICVGNDFSLLGDLNDDDIRQALADNYAEKTGLLPDLVDAIDNLFGTNQTPEPCDVGISTLTDSQKFTARQTSETIYSTIENRFNKIGYQTKYLLAGKSRKLLASYGNLKSSNNAQSFFDFTQQNRADIIDISKVGDSEYVAEPIRDAVKNLIADPDYAFKYETTPDNEKKLIFGVGIQDFQTAVSQKNQGTVDAKRVNFDFNFNENTLLFQYGLTDEEANTDTETPEGVVLVDSIAEYQKFDYLTNNDGDLVEPTEVLFGNEENSNIKGVILQPKYSEMVKLQLSDAIFSNADEHYLEILNSILKDLTQYSLKTGLFEKKNFLKLNLERHLTPVKVDLGDGQPPVDACFLGFANKEVLHRQTEFIADILACRNNSPTKTPFNMAYIKILFDCFIRAIAMGEMMKSFFVLGIFPQDLAFDDITPDNISLYEEVMRINTINSIETFDPYLNRTEKKKKIFNYQEFYNNVFKQFVVDMSRVIFKNNDLGEKQAYDFVVNAQIQFVKNQFKKAFQNAFGNSQSILGVSEYQLLTQEIVNGAAQAVDSDPLDLSKEFTYNERIRAIQNDTLAEYFDEIKNVGVVSGDISLGNTRTFFGGQEVEIDESYDVVGFGTILGTKVLLDFDEKMPLFKRESDAAAPTTEENKSASGLVLDTFIELKPNIAAFSDEQRAFIENRLKYLGRMIVSSKLSQDFEESVEKSITINILGVDIPFVETSYEVNFEKMNLFIKEIFSYTGLFTLIPQATRFFSGALSHTFRTKYLESGISSWEKSQSPFQELDSYQSSEFGLFYWLFRYNYDPDFLLDPAAVEWHNKMMQSGLWQDLNHSLTGKIKLGDFYYLLDMMSHTLHSLGAIAAIYQLNQKIPQDFSWIFGSLIGDNAQLTTSPEFEDENFFVWLYSQNVDELFHANTVLRIDTKLSEEDSFDITNNFAQNVFDQGDTDEANKNNIAMQRILLEEKIGPEILNNSQLFSSPMFELKQPFPNNLSLQSFVLQVDKFSWFKDDNFYNIFNVNEDTTTADIAEMINTASSINEFIFAGDKRDAYSYFYRLKSFSNASHGKSQVVKNKQYFSTFWWNIKGRPVNLQAILKAVYLDFSEDEKYTPAYNATNPITYKEIRESLTGFSLRSFLVPADEIFPPAIGPDNSLGKALMPPGTIPFSSFESGDNGILYLTKESGYNTSKSLIIAEKIALVDQEIARIAKSPGLTEPGATGLSEYFASYDIDKGTFKEGFRPFIAIKEWDGSGEDKAPVDYGFYLWHQAGTNYPSYDALEAESAKLNNMYVGSDFDKAFTYAKNAKESSHAPFGPIDGFVRPSGWVAGTNEKLDLGVFGNIDNAVYNPSTKIWASWIGRGTYVKGGLGYAEESILEKPVPGNVLSVYDLFAKTIKSNSDKKTFNKLMESFFLKEQTTIVALINRIITEAEYPGLSRLYNNLAEECYKKLVVAVAVANGDYEQSTKPEEPNPDVGEMLEEIGIILGEAFLKAVASTVDPTWQTPWFAPGPLTPFGFAAKLLGEDFSSDKGTTETADYPPGELACDDSLRDSADFFDKFAAAWEKTLSESSEEGGNTNQE